MLYQIVKVITVGCLLAVTGCTTVAQKNIDCVDHAAADILKPLLSGYTVNPLGVLTTIPSADAYLFKNLSSFAGHDVFDYMRELTHFTQNLETYPASRLALDLHCAGVPKEHADNVFYLFDQADLLQQAGPDIEKHYDSLLKARHRNEVWAELRQRYSDQLSVLQRHNSINIEEIFFRKINDKPITLALISVASDNNSDSLIKKAELIDSDNTVLPGLYLRKQAASTASGERYMMSFDGWPAKDSQGLRFTLTTDNRPDAPVILQLLIALLNDPALYLDY